MDNKLIDAFQGIGAASISIPQLIFSLLIGAGFSWVISWHFRRFGATLSNREEFDQVFPFILLTTILIITVVKSSLALSLGLVGALSIVRFRTPIKEPEELAYLFLSIAVGLGLGAGQATPTITAGLIILIVMGLMRQRKLDKPLAKKGIYMSVDWKAGSDRIPENILGQLNAIILERASSCDLRRYDIRPATLEATYLIGASSVDDLDLLSAKIRMTFPEIGITFLDQSQFHGI